MPFLATSGVLLLIALGIGYVVLYLAKREEKGLRLFGYIIGGAIIALAVIYIILGILIQANFWGKHPYRQMMRQKMMQKQMMQPTP